MLNTTLGQTILSVILIIALLIFFYFFAASNEKRKRSETHKYFSSVVNTIQHEPGDEIQVIQRQPKRVFKKDPQDPLLTFAYLIILPFFCAFVVVIVALLLSGL